MMWCKKCLRKQTTLVGLIIKNFIDTESNLKSSVLRKIVISLGFDYTHYSAKEAFIDKNILAVRNDIAHGEYREINLDDFIEIVDFIIPLMDYFRTQVENAAVTKRYLKVQWQTAQHITGPVFNFLLVKAQMLELD